MELKVVPYAGNHPGFLLELLFFFPQRHVGAGP